MSQQEYKAIKEFFENHSFEVYECLALGSFKRLNTYMTRYEKQVFMRFLKFSPKEILSFSSPLGNFCLYKEGEHLKLKHDTTVQYINNRV